ARHQPGCSRHARGALVRVESCAPERSGGAAGAAAGERRFDCGARDVRREVTTPAGAEHAIRPEHLTVHAATPPAVGCTFPVHFFLSGSLVMDHIAYPPETVEGWYALHQLFTLPPDFSGRAAERESAIA